jgi:hypothetical protein
MPRRRSAMERAPADDWEGELERWLAPFLERLRRQAQRRWAPVYLKGLIPPGERKGVEPMAARIAPGDTQQLHHFVSASPGPRPAGGRAGQGRRPAGGRAGRGAGRGRHRPGEAGPPLGRRAAAVLRPARQAGQPPGAGLAHPGPVRGAGRRRPASLPARGLVCRCRAASPW